MHLTRFSDIGLRTLIYLARCSDAANVVTVAEIAGQFELPVNHLVKVVGQLTRGGWVHALRGRNGGLRLAVDPAIIKVGAVLRVLEGDTELVDCDGTACGLARDCNLRDALKQAKTAFYQALDRHTLADVAGGGTGEQIVKMHRFYQSQRQAGL